MGQLVGAHRYSTWQLVQRWLRKHRGAVTVGAILVVVLAAVSIVSVQRIRHERSDAEAARAVAEEQRGLAVASRNDAEDLIGFMLGDLKDKLEPVGKLDILDPVVAKTIAYYSKRPADADDADEHGKRARAFESVGDVRQPEGNLPGALDAYRTALALREQLAASPTAYAARGELAETHLSIGDVLNAQGNGSAALAEYKLGLAIAGSAASGAPTDDDLAEIVAAAHADIGDVERVQGQPDTAVDDYRASIAERAAIAKRSPSVLRKRKLAGSYTSLAGGLYIKGDLGAGVDAARAAIAIIEPLAAADPKDMNLQRDLGFQHHRAADVLLAESKFPDALAEVTTAVAIEEALVARDPTNSQWLRDLETTYGTRARVQIGLGDAAGAVATGRLGVATADRLTKLDPANNDWRIDLAKQHQFVSMILRHTKDLDGALAEIALGRVELEKLAASAPGNATYQQELAACHNIAGNALTSSTDEAKVRAGIVEYEAATAIFKKLVATTPDSLTFQRQYADTVENIADNLASLDAPTPGDLARAKAIYAEIVPIYETLVVRVPSDNSSRESLIIIHMNSGDLVAKTDAAAARAEYEKAVAVGKDLIAVDATNARWKQLADKAGKQLAECCKK
jgi:tetratricopeptide (TPR) repeat protein